MTVFLIVLAAIAVFLVVGFFMLGRPLSPEELKEFNKAQAKAKEAETAEMLAQLRSLDSRDGHISKGLHKRGDHHTAEFARCLEIAFESQHIVNSTKNLDTLLSRLGVAMSNLDVARVRFPELLPAAKADQLIADLQRDARARVMALGAARVDDLAAKAMAYKTEKARRNGVERMRDALVPYLAVAELSDAERASLNDTLKRAEDRIIN